MAETGGSDESGLVEPRSNLSQDVAATSSSTIGEMGGWVRHGSRGDDASGVSPFLAAGSGRTQQDREELLASRLGLCLGRRRQERTEYLHEVQIVHHVIQSDLSIGEAVVREGSGHRLGPVWEAEKVVEPGEDDIPFGHELLVLEPLPFQRTIDRSDHCLDAGSIGATHCDVHIVGRQHFIDHIQVSIGQYLVLEPTNNGLVLLCSHAGPPSSWRRPRHPNVVPRVLIGRIGGHCPSSMLPVRGGWSFFPVSHGPPGHRRCRAAKRVIRRPATMDCALFRPDEAFMGRRVGRARQHCSGRCGNARRDVRLHCSQGLEWPGPCRHIGALAPSATGTRFAAAKRTAGTPGRTARADHHDGANDFRPGRARRLPRAPAPPPPALTAAVAPSGPRDVSSAGEVAGAVDLTRRGAHREGHVDLGVGQH